MGLVIADGSGPRRWGGRQAKIEWLPYIPQWQFIDTLSGSHVVHLPVRETGRSAGQMVLVAPTEDVRRSIRERWERDFSLCAFSSSVLYSLSRMGWPESTR